MNQDRKLDNLTFNTMYGVLQSGMWLLNDIEQFLAPMKMSQGRLTILLNLTSNSNGEINPMEIAKITGKSRPTITKMIERLVADGHIKSKPSRKDSRKKVLRITESGKDLLTQIVPGYNRRLRNMSEELTSQDKRDLLRILGKISFLDPEKKIGTIL